MPSAANGWAGQPPPTWQQGYGPQGKALAQTSYYTPSSKLNAEVGHEEARVGRGGAPYSTGHQVPGFRLVTRSISKEVWPSVVCWAPAECLFGDWASKAAVRILALVFWGGSSRDRSGEPGGLWRL